MGAVLRIIARFAFVPGRCLLASLQEVPEDMGILRVLQTSATTAQLPAVYSLPEY